MGRRPPLQNRAQALTTRSGVTRNRARSKHKDFLFEAPEIAAARSGAESELVRHCGPQGFSSEYLIHSVRPSPGFSSRIPKSEYKWSRNWCFCRTTSCHSCLSHGKRPCMHPPKIYGGFKKSTEMQKLSSSLESACTSGTLAQAANPEFRVLCTPC